MPPHVQIDNLDPVISYNVGGTPRDEFPTNFSFFDNTDLIVEVGGTVMTLDEDYTVTGAGVTGAGLVTLTQEVTDTTVVITRVLPIERNTDFPNSGPLDMTALNTQLDKIVAMLQQVDADASGSTGQSILAQTIAARDAALLAASSLGGNLFTGYAVTPEMFGAAGTAATDTTGIQAAINSGAKAIRYQPREYLLQRPGIVLAANQAHIGVEGATVWKATEAMGVNTTSDMVYATEKDNITLYGITFDGNGFLTGAASHDPGGTEGDGNFFFVHPVSRFPGMLPCVHMSFCDNGIITRCRFIGYDTSGLLYNTGERVIISENYFERTGQERLYPNYAIVYSGSDANNQFVGWIVNNRTINGGIAGNSSRTCILGNRISGWAMGAGINQNAVSWAGDNIIANNIVHDSNRALDLDNYAPGGIENFSKRPVIVGNSLFKCYGVGMYNFGEHAAIVGNTAYDNGSGGGGSGIYLLASLYSDLTPARADYCMVTGNRCFDTRVGGAKTQNEGYLEQTGSALVGTKVWGNNFAGNRFNEMILDGPGTESPERPWRSFATTIGATTGAFAGGGITGSLFYNIVGTRLDFVFTSTTGAAGVGTAAGALTFTIPFDAAREQSVSALNRFDGTACYGRTIGAADDVVHVRRYDNSFPAGNNAIIVVSGSVEVIRW